MSTTRRILKSLAASLTVLAVSCSAPQLAEPPTADTTVATEPASPAQPECTADEATLDPTRSYEPLSPMPEAGRMPDGSSMAAIAQRGRLIVGVSADTLQFGARNPFTGAIEGFDVDMLKEVAKAIFGPEGGDLIEYKVITYAQRLPSLEAGDVDLVAHTMTINCRRWLRIAFSSTYFLAGQKVLVRKGSGFSSIDALVKAKARVCAPDGSTNIDELKNNPKYAGVQPVAKPDITDCLVAVQQGEADAITADDTVLVGFAKQDPNLEVVGEQFTSEPYGIGVNAKQVDLVKFVNGVLDAVRADGRWTGVYAKWVGTQDVPAPPPAVYGRQEP